MVKNWSVKCLLACLEFFELHFFPAYWRSVALKTLVEECFSKVFLSIFDKCYPERELGKGLLFAETFLQMLLKKLSDSKQD